jgi:hypothetical protein
MILWSPDAALPDAACRGHIPYTDSRRHAKWRAARRRTAPAPGSMTAWSTVEPDRSCSVARSPGNSQACIAVQGQFLTVPPRRDAERFLGNRPPLFELYECSRQRCVHGSSRFNPMEEVSIPAVAAKADTPVCRAFYRWLPDRNNEEPTSGPSNVNHVDQIEPRVRGLVEVGIPVILRRSSMPALVRRQRDTRGTFSCTILLIDALGGTRLA